MLLKELINHMYENTTIWITENPNMSEGLFFNGVKYFDKEGDLANRWVKEFYPEHYHSIGGICGITIVVEELKNFSINVDVIVQGDGSLDVFIAEESSSGSHYNKVKSEDVGRFVEEEIKNLMDHR